MDIQMNLMEKRYQSVERFSRHGLLIPPPPLHKGANEFQKMFHTVKKQSAEALRNR
jgi:hypothetical protein